MVSWCVDLSLWMSIGFLLLPRPICLFINNKCKLSRGILNCKSLISRRLPIFVRSLWLFISFSRSACVGNNIGDCQFLCNPNNYSLITHALLLNVLLNSHITTQLFKTPTQPIKSSLLPLFTMEGPTQVFRDAPFWCISFSHQYKKKKSNVYTYKAKEIWKFFWNFLKCKI